MKTHFLFSVLFPASILIFLTLSTAETYYGAEFDYLVRGARNDAMGGASCASGADAFSLFVNPAQLTFLSSRQVVAEYTPLWDLGDDFMNAAVAVPVDTTLVMALGYSRFQVNNIPWYGELSGGSTAARYDDITKQSTGLALGSFGAAYDLLSFGLAKSVTLHLSQEVFYKLAIPATASGGCAIKFFRQSFSFPSTLSASTYEGHATDVDAGFSLEFVLDKDLSTAVPSKIFRTGLSLRNLFRTDITYNTGENYSDAGERIRTFGLSYWQDVKALQGGFTGTLDLIRRRNEQIRRLGLEYGFRGLLFARIGLHEGGTALGLGLKYRALGVDYSFRAHEFADTPYRLTLTFSF